MNPKYDSTFVFVNDYSAVKEEQAAYDDANSDGSNSPMNFYVSSTGSRRCTDRA